MIRWKLWVNGRKTTRWGDILLTSSLRVLRAKKDPPLGYEVICLVSHHKFNIFSFSYAILWAGVTKSHLQSRKGNQVPCPGGGRRVPVCIIWNSSVRNICPFFSFIYFFSLFISLWNYGHEFCFVTQIAPVLTFGISLWAGLCVLWASPCPCLCLPFFIWNSFLLSGPTRCSRLILYSPCPALQSAISPRSPNFFSLENDT